MDIESILEEARNLPKDELNDLLNFAFAKGEESLVKLAILLGADEEMGNLYLSACRVNDGQIDMEEIL